MTLYLHMYCRAPLPYESGLKRVLDTPGLETTLIAWSFGSSDIYMCTPKNMPMELKNGLKHERVIVHNAGYITNLMLRTGICILPSHRITDVMEIGKLKLEFGGFDYLCNRLGIKYKRAEGLIRLFSLLDNSGKFTEPKDRPTLWKIYKTQLFERVEALRDIHLKLGSI